MHRHLRSTGLNELASDTLSETLPSLIKGKDIELISKPSVKLALIMRRFFFKGSKAAKYGKLKTSPQLLDSLDIDSLLPLDLELQRFLSVINMQWAGNTP